ncbi:MAG: carbohydrate ABC transporter permease [Nocardioides sp.]
MTHASPTQTTGPASTSTPYDGARKKPRKRRLRPADRWTVIIMVTVPTVLVVGLVWLPAIASVVLSFFRWDGLGSIDTAEFIGWKNYDDIVNIYPPFWPAIRHNLVWLVALFVVPTLLGMLLAVILDRELRGSKFYQTAFFLPTVLSLALIGFIWQLIYSRDQGLINGITGGTTDWYGDPDVNLWAVIVAAGWRHTGYIMLLYLAGLKGVDPGLREAAKVDGANERQTFFRVIFPVMRPINIIVLVITVIESLRAFDLVWVINKGRNGLELISALVLQNIVGEASRVGFGSALATMMLVVSSVFVVLYLRIVMKEDER